MQQDVAPQGSVSTPMANFAQTGSFPNMNPALNNQMAAPENVQVMNVLDQSQTMNVLEQQAMADVGFLEGIPGAMFDWGTSVSTRAGAPRRCVFFNAVMAMRRAADVLHCVQASGRTSSRGSRRN